MQYREQVVPIFNLFSDRIHLLSADESLSFSALLLEHKKHFFAFHVDCIQDLRRINEADLKDSFSPNKAIKGNAVCEGKTIPIVDLEYCVKKHTNSKKQDVRAEIVKAS
jgi:chemotaxis signal transduction protein